MNKFLVLQSLLIVCGIISKSDALEKRDVHRIILKEEVQTSKPHRSTRQHRHHQHGRHKKNYGYEEDYGVEDYKGYDSFENSYESNNYRHKDHSSKRGPKRNTEHKFRSSRQKSKSSDHFGSSTSSVFTKHPPRKHQTSIKVEDFLESPSYFQLGDQFSATHNHKITNSPSPLSRDESTPSRCFGTSCINATQLYRVYEDPKYEEFPPYHQKYSTTPANWNIGTHNKRFLKEVNGGQEYRSKNHKHSGVTRKTKKSTKVFN